MRTKPLITCIYGALIGNGGLGIHTGNIFTCLATGESEIHAFGPGRSRDWPMTAEVSAIEWHQSPNFLPSWAARFSPLRWYKGRLQFEQDRHLGQWAAAQVERLRPEHCYAFTQIGLETLGWARRAGIPSVLDNPNGHIRGFREVYQRESLRWCGKDYLGHPTPAMVERVEEEYQLADRIRVSSEWAKASMIARGVPAEKIEVRPQLLDLRRFSPGPERPLPNGRLRVCYVGSLDLRKGFVYLLRAIRAIGPERIDLEIVGATGDRCCRRLLELERVGLNLESAPGDPVPAYRRAEIFVLPSLEDGYGLVVAEAMACGLPVIVTDQCGAAELVRPGQTGWIVPAGRAEALAGALEEALGRRKDLQSMGRQARAIVEIEAGPRSLAAFRDWFYNKRR